MVARRLVLAAGSEGRDGLVNRGDDGRFGPAAVPESADEAGFATHGIARFFGVDTAAALTSSRSALPGMLDRIDGWIESGVLNGDELNAADFMIAPSLALLTYAAISDRRSSDDRRSASWTACFPSRRLACRGAQPSDRQRPRLPHIQRPTATEIRMPSDRRQFALPSLSRSCSACLPGVRRRRRDDGDAVGSGASRGEERLREGQLHAGTIGSNKWFPLEPGTQSVRLGRLNRGTGSSRIAASSRSPT